MTQAFIEEIESGNLLGMPVMVFRFGSRTMYKDPNTFMEVMTSYARPDSDWDYAAQDSSELYEALHQTGWTPSPEMDYSDRFSTHTFTKTFQGEKVQLCLKKDLRAFKAAWHSIADEFYGKFFYKESPTYFGKEGITEFMNSLEYVYNCGEMFGKENLYKVEREHRKLQKALANQGLSALL